MKTLVLSSLLILSYLTYGQWDQVGQSIYGGINSETGRSVAINSTGNIVAVGSPKYGNTDVGSVRIYQFDCGTWEQMGFSLFGEADNDQFGSSVDINSSGDIVAVGAMYNDGNGANSGHVRVYQYISNNWVQIGEDINGEQSGDACNVVSLSGDGLTLAVGAHLNDGNGSNSGHVRIYHYQAGGWVQLGDDIDGENSNDWSGSSIDINDSGDIVAIGALSNPFAGHVRIFQLQAGNWIQLGSDINGESSGDDSGTLSLNCAGDIVSIGARLNDGGATNGGHVRIFKYDGTNWLQKGGDIDGLTSDGDFGMANAINCSGDTVAIGARWNNEGGSLAGQVRVFYFDGSNWSALHSEINGASSNSWFGHSIDLSSNGKTFIAGAPFGSGFAQVYSTETYNSNSDSTFTISTCENYTVPSGDETYTLSGIYLDTIPNINGCDSILTINLTVTQSDTNIDTQTACGPYTWIDGNVYTTSNNTATHTLMNTQGCDSIINLNLTINNTSTGIDFVTACDSYTWIDGMTYTSSNNTATHTLTNAQGCDSVVTLNLVINSVDTGVASTDPTLTADATGANYQWLECPSYALISGETSQSFTATQNGDYAVEITENGCVDTSDCILIQSVGINELEINLDFKVYPNPSDGFFTIEFQGASEVRILSVFTMEGKLVEQMELSGSEQKIELDLESGVYFLEIFSSKFQAVKKIIIE